MKNKAYPLYDVKRITNLRQLIEFRAEETPSATAFAYAGPKGSTVQVTYSEWKKQTEAFGTALFDMGIKDCHVAILGENSFPWILSFFSLTGGNNVAVPIDRELSADMIAQLVRDSDCSVMIYSDTYADVAAKLQETINIRYINMNEINDLLARGNELILVGNDEYLKHRVDEDCTSVIVYTSGTTGISKGVMLSHRNFALDTYSAGRNFKADGSTVLLLPLHHTFGLVAGVFVSVLYGQTIYINSSLRHLSADLKNVKPQVLFVVPLIVENLYKNIWNTAEQKGKAGALRVLIKLSNALLALGIDVRRKIFASVLAGFGGQLDTIVCGGAPLNLKYIQGFRDFGINLLNGYGITECSPVISVNRNEYYRDGSVGQILSECNVKIENPDSDGSGEICVSGSIVMKGYYKMERETDAVISQGWFHTGDIGYLDSDRFLYVTGRKKNLIILSNGENVAPEELETLLQNIPLVCEVVVFEQQGKIMAEIYPDTPYAEKNGISDIKNELNIHIRKINNALPRFKQIHSITLRDTEFEKTTTKKIKRIIGR